MNRSTLRILIIVFTLITAAIHLFLGFSFFGEMLGKLFVLNGLGYLVLLAALLFDFPKGRSSLVHYALIAFAAVTIIAYFAVNDTPASPVGLITKLDEVLLIIVTYLHLRAQ